MGMRECGPALAGSARGLTAGAHTQADSQDYPVTIKVPAGNVGSLQAYLQSAQGRAAVAVRQQQGALTCMPH